MAVSRLQPVSQINGTNRLRLAIALPWRDQAGLTTLLQQIYDSASPNYHHYLSAAQFAERFAPTDADYQTLTAFATSHHLTVTATHPNRMLLDVEASVADVERALHVTLRLYRHPTEPRDFFAPDVEPSIDLNLPVLHISGLDNYVLPHPLSGKMPGEKGRVAMSGGGTNLPPLSGSGPQGSYLGYDFRRAYAPGVTLTGSGQNAALFELDGYYPGDITAYEMQAGLPTSATLINVPIDGGITGAPGGGVGEVSLDIEMVIAMAPGISTIYVYEAPNGSPEDDILNRMASDNSAKQISSSWVFGDDSGADQDFQEFAAQGQSFYQASGDSDAYVGLIAAPEDNPYITLVGGTELVMSGSGTSYASESVWNTGYMAPGGAPQFSNYWGSGGGISTTYPIPSWQQGVATLTNGGSTTFRNLPDVALTADNIWVNAGNTTNNGVYMGTSCAAPLWCGFTALINQQAVANGESTQGFINPAIYALGKGSSFTSCFHDVIAGSNTWSGSSNAFFAVPGYDLCTGWGSPMGAGLINALAPLVSTPLLAVATNIISGGNGNGVVDYDECNDLAIILTNQGRVAATGIQATLYSTTYGAIVGQGLSAYPAIPTNGSATNLTLFQLSTQPTFVCGTPINLVLVLKFDQGSQTNYVQLRSGRIGPSVTFTSLTPISIPTNQAPTNSPIVVSGLQSVGKMTVSVYLLSQDDGGITMRLIGPNGTNVLLSQNIGEGGTNYGSGCGSGLETVFDDAAALPISLGSPPFMGSFQPQQPLSAFDFLSGANLNGTWHLQVQDEFSTDTDLLECWSLTISPSVCEDGGGQCPGANLSLAMSAASSLVFVGSNEVYSLTVSNAGPSPAQNVVITQTLPPGVIGVSVLSGSVGVAQTTTNITMTLASLPVYGVVTVPVSMLFTTNTLGTNIATLVSSAASVTSAVPGPNPGITNASVTVLLTEPAADLAVTMTGSPSSVLQGALLTYTINVTNNGPFTALGVTLATVLPPSANFISATTSQGTVSFNGSFAALGDIPVGTSVVVTIVVSPTITGNLTASTTVSLGANSNEIDPNLYNNYAAVSAIVGPAADLGVTAVASPNPVVEGHNLGYIGTVSNAGPNTATTVLVSQSLPAGSTFISSSLPGHTVANNLVSATISNLASGASVVFVNVVQSPTLASGIRSNYMVSTFSVFGQPGDPNLGNNVFTLTNLEEVPTVTIVAAGATITSGSSNGAVGPGGTYVVQLSLQNVGNVATTNLVATLQNGHGVTSSSGSQTYGALQPEAAPTARQFSFTASSTNGGTILAVLQLQDGASNLGTATFTFVMPVVTSFWNTNFISIPGQMYIPYPDEGPANPYPSDIAVSGVNGDVSAVTVTVSNLIHGFPHDIGMLLVGPTGASCVLMSAAADYSTITTPITVTFDQTAPLLPTEGDIVSASYQPADYYASQYGTTETFSKSLVPVGPYNTNLTVFSSVPANGTWALYIEDDADGDAGAISNGWGLAFTIISPVNQVADLVVGIAALTNQVVLGNNITNIWTVTNNGPDAADVFVTNILPAGLALFTNTLPLGATINQSGPTNIYNLGTLAAGNGVIITNVVTAESGGLQTNSITAGSAALDGSPSTSTATVVTMVTLPPADLAVGPISVVPNPGVLHGSLIYTLFVTNNGPSNALNVVGVFSNLAGLNVVSANPSQGSCSNTANTVQCNLGTIPDGEHAVVVITATSATTGLLTSVWSVTNTLGVDNNLANNSTAVQVTVTLPMAIITNGTATLLSQGSAPYNGAINPNQTNTVAFNVVNIGTAATANLVATLQANSGLRPITTTASYGAIAPGGGTASQSYTFVGTGGSGANITAQLSLQDGAANLGSVEFTFLMPATQSFTNSGAITIPYIGPGTPYPSSILVSGLTNAVSNLSVAKVTATLLDFAHSWPDDVEVELVSPAGQGVMLMEHTGAFYNVTNVVLTFDSTDAAAQNLASNSSLVSGTFLPTAFSPFDTLPGLALVPAGNTNLDLFNGTNPNGIWSLYVYDDTQGNNGVITRGWSLSLTSVSPVNTSQVSSAPPSWTNAVVSAGGIFQATLVGSLDQSYAIQSSSNLVNWHPVSTNSGTFIFTNNMTNAPQMFYRAIQLSP